MAENPTAEETLMRLAQSRVATHMLRFSDAVIEAANMDDEVAALEQLSDLVDGPIYRISPLTYAFAMAEGAETLGAALAERLGGCDAPEVTPLPTPAEPEPLPAPRRDALTMMGALAAPDDALGGNGRVVIDARFAAAAAEATAGRIDGLVRDLEARLAALPAPEDNAARLDRIEARLEALASATALPAADDGDRLDRIEAALGALAARAAAPGDVDARLERIESALGGLSALDTLTAEMRAAGEARALDRALVDELRAIAARPVANVDFHAEREGLSRLSTALQTMLGRMDAEITRLVEAQGAAGQAVHAETGPETDPALLERLDALSAALAALGEVRGGEAAALGGLVAQMREIAERPVANIDLHAEREGLSRLSTALQAMLVRMDAEITRLVEAQGAAGQAVHAETGVETDPALLERLDDLSASVAALGEGRGGDAETLDALVARLREIAERPIANIDFHVEREGLSRLSTALQTMLGRMDAEITRLVEAQAAAPAPTAAEADPAILERLDALSEVVALLAQGRDVERDETDALIARLREIAERPIANIDLVAEREGLTRLSSALQTMLSRMDAEITRLVEAAQGDADGKLDAVVDLARRAAEAAEAARPDGLRDEFAALAGEVRALAEKSGGGDLRRERESLMRLAFSLQTAVSRLDGEVSRLIDAGLGGGDAAVLERIEALAAAVAPLGRSLSEIESASALGADHAGALVDLVQAMREDLAELHGLHGRYFEALDQTGGLGAGEDLMERISATLAEFLARMERFETQRIGGGARHAVGLAGRLGRTP